MQATLAPPNFTNLRSISGNKIQITWRFSFNYLLLLNFLIFMAFSPSHLSNRHDDSDDDDEINPFPSLLLPPAALHHAPLIQSPPRAAVDLHCRRYHVTYLDADVVIRQLPSEGLSFQLWPAGDTMFSLLDSRQLHRFLCRDNRSRLRLLELGSGTGLVGIAAAAVLGADVTVTDLAHVVPNLEHNVAANAAVVAAGGGVVVAAEMSWGNIAQMEVIGRDYDVIIGSDVVYHDNLYGPLLDTLKFFLVDGGGGGGEETLFLMAHLKRWKKEAVFFKKARKVFNVDVVHRDCPSDGKRVGVIVYRFTAKQRSCVEVKLGNGF